MVTKVLSLNETEHAALVSALGIINRCAHIPEIKNLAEKVADRALPLYGILFLSSRHLSNDSIDWLDDRCQEVHEGKASHNVCRTSTGYIAYCDEENGAGDIPADLFECMQKGRDLGAEYLRFDDTWEPDHTLDLPVFEVEMA